MAISEVEAVSTELGHGRMFSTRASVTTQVLVVGHGAGGGVDAPDLLALTTGLVAHGVSVLRFEQPWRTAGKRVAPNPARLDIGWRAALEHVSAAFPGLPIVVGGRSAGARVACRYAATSPVAGVLALSFPLHPPGKPQSSRAGELLAAQAPVLIAQGERDPFGTPAEFAPLLAEQPQNSLISLPGIGHEFKPGKRAAVGPEQLGALLCREVLAWLASLG